MPAQRFSEFPTKIIEAFQGQILFNEADIESSHRDLMVKRVKSRKNEHGEKLLKNINFHDVTRDAPCCPIIQFSGI